MTKQLTVQDYLEIARRRKWFLIIPPIIFGILGLAASFVLPPKYTSQTLVLVEGQKVAESLVKPAVTEDLNERLLTMKEQILSRSRLEPVMQKFGLYKDQMNKTPMEDLVDKMRKNIQVQPIRGEKEGSTTGFYISFVAQNPKLAQDVCSEITSLFMEQNLKLREEQAVGTTEFLASQLADSKRNLDQHDAKLAAFERKYMGQLPGEETVNMNMLTSLRTQLDGVTQALNRAQQDKLYANTLLAQQSTNLRVAQGPGDGLSASQADDELKKLKQTLADLEARYTPQHPDVVKTKAMIASLEESLQAPTADRKKNPAQPEPSAVETIPSPEVQRLRDNIHVLDVTIREKSAEQTRLQQAIKQYESRIELTPSVTEQYKQLTRDYQTALSLYDDLLKKKSESEMSTDLERRQEGEQFRVVDPANLPETPSFPNRIQFGGGGFGLGLCFAATLVYLLELASRSIRTESDIEFYLKLPVLASIPEIHRPEAAKVPSKGGRLRQKPEASRTDIELVNEEAAVEGR